MRHRPVVLTNRQDWGVIIWKALPNVGQEVSKKLIIAIFVLFILFAMKTILAFQFWLFIIKMMLFSTIIHPIVAARNVCCNLTSYFMCSYQKQQKHFFILSFFMRMTFSISYILSVLWYIDLMRSHAHCVYCFLCLRKYFARISEASNCCRAEICKQLWVSNFCIDEKRH